MLFGWEINVHKRNIYEFTQQDFMIVGISLQHK